MSACAGSTATGDPDALTLASCTYGAASGAIDCGTLEVFENRAAGRGRRIGISFVVLRATDGPARSAVFVFAGGPGQGGMTLIDAADGWLRPVRTTLDIVLVDQRGTGASHGLQCDVGLDADPARIFGHVFDPDLTRRCRETLSTSADLTQYITAHAIEDIDDVRAALGYSRISLYGGSYGTRVAQAYARRFPDRVRSLVLDGVVPFDVSLPVTYAASAQHALDLVLEHCRERPTCHAAHPTLLQDFQALLDRFAGGSVPVTIAPRGRDPITVAMSRGDFGYAVRGILYAARAVEELPEMISRAAATGDLREFAQRYWDRADRLDRTLARGQHLSVLCAEDVAFVDDAAPTTAAVEPFLGRYLLDEYRRACDQWSVPRVAESVRAPLDSAAPTLLVSGRFDPVTPPQFADRVARHLTNARHVVSPATAHGSAAGCPRAAVLHVLIAGTIEGVPAVCQP